MVISGTTGRLSRTTEYEIYTAEKAIYGRVTASTEIVGLLDFNIMLHHG